MPAGVKWERLADILQFLTIRELSDAPWSRRRGVPANSVSCSDACMHVKHLPSRHISQDANSTEMRAE